VVGVFLIYIYISPIFGFFFGKKATIKFGFENQKIKNQKGMLIAFFAAGSGLVLFAAGTCTCYGIEVAYLAVPLAAVALLLTGGVCMGAHCVVSCLQWLSGCCLPSSAQWLAYFLFWFLLFGAGVSLPVAGLSGGLVASCHAESQHKVYWGLSCVVWAFLPAVCVYTYVRTPSRA
jgi:hypothetical protein